MNQRKPKGKYILGSACLLLALLFVALKVNSNTEPFKTDLKPKRYRYFCLYSGDNDYYIEKLINGIREAEEANDVWVTIQTFGSDNIEGHASAFEKAIESKADGIITNIPSKSRLGSLIDMAAGEKIPVITISSDFYGSQRKMFLGLDAYSIGREAARLLSQMTNDKARTVAIVYSQSNIVQEDSQKIQGFQDGIAGIPGMSLGFEYLELADYYSAYGMAKRIMDSKINYDSFFCIDENITRAVAKCIMDTQKTGKVTVIGCGNTTSVLDYIKQGVIDAILLEDPYFVGKSAVTYMTEFIDGKVSLPFHLDLEIQIVSRDNIGAYYD